MNATSWVLVLLGIALLAALVASGTTLIGAGQNEPTILRAQACNAQDKTGSQAFVAACTGTYPSACSAEGGSDLLSCDDAAPETVTGVTNNNYVGHNFSAYNSSVTNCGEIISVRVCHQWEIGSAVTYGNCFVGVDNDNGEIWATAAISCPTTTSTAVVCTDVTGLETDWSCSDFFGITSASAWGYVEAQRTQGGPGHTYSTDALYFNVTYESDTFAPNLTILAPLAGLTLTGDVLINVSTNDTYAQVRSVNATLSNSSGNVTATLALNLSIGSNASGYWNVTILAAGLADGQYNISVNATDSNGNQNVSDNVTFTLDQNPPLVQLMSPANNTELASSQVTFTYNVSDVSALQSCSLVLHDAINQTNETAVLKDTPQSFVQTLNDGLYNWSVNCTDINSFEGASFPFNLSVNTSVAPSINEINLTAPVNLAAEDFTPVTCNASVSPPSELNISRVNATLFDNTIAGPDSTDDLNSHYTNASCANLTGATEGIYSCGFSVAYFANNASWSCALIATDTDNRTTTALANTTINELIALRLNSSIIDYGAIKVGNLSNLSNLTTYNLGNVPINLTGRVYGETDGDEVAMTCGYGSTIAPLYQRFSTNRTELFGNMRNLSGTDGLLPNLTLGQRVNDLTHTDDYNITYWRVLVPNSTAGSCNGTIVLSAIRA